ncbi:hypothetical protein SCUCBS95973_009749 [Sporothrix curviconia]|uniref:Amine oxidase n=1 Tax=Sporothrix curviconia TaxID=1260050 RepID=A0ABP0D093_9PEZI
MVSNPSGYRSRDGFQWTKETGLQAGIPSLGVIRPSNNLPSTAQSELYDVVVIGGGYTGLTAIRDLAIAGYKVLLIEARDRIGGRSWSSNIDNYPYEMGGTWIHWNQPFVWRELFRYDLSTKIDISIAKEGGLNSEAVAKYDKMSLADRFAEVAHDMTPLERNMFEAFLSITCGSQTWEEASFFEFLRWWALMNYSYTDFIALGLTYKFQTGQSSLARGLFDEALATGNLTYVFDAPVTNVVDSADAVSVTVAPRGQPGAAAAATASYRARRGICTVPLNVLYKINFTPPLLGAKIEASKLGHVNRVSKVHAELANTELRSVGAFSWPSGKLTYGFGDGTTPAGNTHMVAFGSAHAGIHLQPEENIEDTLAAWQNLVGGEGRQVDIRRVVFHNWHKDEFAQGAWEWLRPGMSTKYLDPLRERQGNVLFASADWAMGWRGFIDGAIEDGGRAAKEIASEIPVASHANWRVPLRSPFVAKV